MASKMIKIAIFDLLKFPNLISRKIRVSQSENLIFLKLSNVQLSPKIKIPDLQNYQNWIFMSSKIPKIWVSQSENW